MFSYHPGDATVSRRCNVFFCGFDFLGGTDPQQYTVLQPQYSGYSTAVTAQQPQRHSSTAAPSSAAATAVQQKCPQQSSSNHTVVQQNGPQQYTAVTPQQQQRHSSTAATPQQYSSNATAVQQQLHSGPSSKPTVHQQQQAHLRRFRRGLSVPRLLPRDGMVVCVTSDHLYSPPWAGTRRFFPTYGSSINREVRYVSIFCHFRSRVLYMHADLKHAKCLPMTYHLSIPGGAIVI